MQTPTNKAHLQIMKIVKQYLRDKGKLHWGANATWKRAKLIPDTVSFGVYCEETDTELDTLDDLAGKCIDPFNAFGNEKQPFSYRKFLDHFQDNNPSWMTSQIIANHIIYTVNGYYRGSEELFRGQSQTVRIVNQWVYSGQRQVKTIYGNIYTISNSRKKLSWEFEGFVNDDTKTITVCE